VSLGGQKRSKKPEEKHPFFSYPAFYHSGVGFPYNPLNTNIMPIFVLSKKL
jgi:hypothetical protein